jgi:adenylyltransferase/sulfurtransferase
MTVTELKTELDAGRELLLLDVREPDELEVSRMANITAIPMGEVPARVQELDREADVVVVCRSGGRSARIVAFLEGEGFQRVRNLDGGMNAWATQIDPSLPVY